MSGATREGTAGLAQRFRRLGYSADSYPTLGKTGWSVSALGFGAYRVDDQTPEHREALRRALAEGCNLIDTSTNYTDGGSESCIGEVLEETIHRGDLHREEQVIVSKIGYVQGGNLDLAREREKAGDPFPEMVKVSGGCWHCIHPRFLEDQLGRSLERLKLARLDVCLLHNPEYFLEDAHRKGENLESARREFYARIRAAFVRMEEEVKRGRIAWYGVSSNSLGQPAEDREATSLGRMLEAAREAAAAAGIAPGDHHFTVAQLPLNLFEHSPLSVRKEGVAGDRSTLAFAVEAGVGVLVNRPLNAFAQGELIRLADFPMEPPKAALNESLKQVAALEQEFMDGIGSRLRRGADGPRPESLFPWGRQLAGLAGRVG
ncbi:MAG TPA: aldo/keto reductase, partial [Candidatus Polarisedimenticolia bacterium]|nr:aldo/keto reductase [Candidatus Polarisedimenticolia bacterium]